GLAHLRRDPPEALVFLDADDFAAPGQLPALLRPLREGAADLVVGERRSVEGPGVRRHARLGNRLVLVVQRGLYGATVRDMGPFRAIRWRALERLGLDDPTYGWYVQMQVRALRAGLRVIGVPVRFERRTVGRSKISGSVRASTRAGRIMLRTLAVEVLRPSPERVPYAPAAPPAVGPPPRRGSPGEEARDQPRAERKS
ncbi:MAG: glycosyltransferase, partial [Gemmatimonadota bacterium]